jgi:hypothetical protein
MGVFPPHITRLLQALFVVFDNDSFLEIPEELWPPDSALCDRGFQLHTVPDVWLAFVGTWLDTQCSL